MNADHIIPGQETIEIVDCHYFEPLRMSAYLIEENGRAAFVDAGTRYSIPHLLAALERRGLTPAAVDYIILTHIHLDHAGGAAELLNHCSKAVILAHPRALKHLADPTRLLHGVKAVYGAEYVDRVYGQIDPIDPERIQAVGDEARLVFGGRTLRFLHTRGHANHHICIHDSGSNALFAGDNFGIGRVGPGRAEEPYVVCAAAPADFDPELARQSLNRLLDVNATVVYQGHFGPIVNRRHAAVQLFASITQMEMIMNEGRDSELEGRELVDYCTVRVCEAMLEHRKTFNLSAMNDPIASAAAFLNWFKTDIELNGMGVAAAAERRRKG